MVIFAMISSVLPSFQLIAFFNSLLKILTLMKNTSPWLLLSLMTNMFILLHQNLFRCCASTWFTHDIITNAISNALSPYCTIKEIAPVLISNTNLLTPKWDAVIEPIQENRFLFISKSNMDQLCSNLSWITTPTQKIHINMQALTTL